jgi:hypothetical protein
VATIQNRPFGPESLPYQRRRQRRQIISRDTDDVILSGKNNSVRRNLDIFHGYGQDATCGHRVNRVHDQFEITCNISRRRSIIFLEESSDFVTSMPTAKQRGS